MKLSKFTLPAIALIALSARAFARDKMRATVRAMARLGINGGTHEQC